ncbi:hypothetical protein R1sor_024988 [Riccia sorocarpa]|uniref:Glutamate carboxypeptidase n=1 Tax=Riccia sorocarpa TaxID=122646 RepID=A0ABD3GAJ1_9MARC
MESSRWFQWWDKCIAAGEQPESLLYNENGGRIMRFDISSSPFGRELASLSPRSRVVHCINRCIIYGTLFLIILLLIWWYLLSGVPGGGSGCCGGPYEKTYIDGVYKETIRYYLQDITTQPHVAGTAENNAEADYIRFAFQRFGIPTHYSDYDVLLTYPLNRTLVLSGHGGSSLDMHLEEEVVDEDPYTKNPKIIPPFHGYSPSGNVDAEVVYANYGSQEDFAVLQKMGIKINGSIILARSGKTFRGDVVHYAAQLGAAAVITYSDPIDFANNRTQGYYPQSQWLPPSGAQRGTVFRGVGDPLTPGWPSTKGAEHLDLEDANLPTIPSMPISAENAESIFKALAGQEAPKDWQGGLNLSVYRVGRGPARLNFTFEAEQGIYTVRNVIGMIEGCEEPDRYIIVGNHRDAWVYGAVDPSSGTAALLTMAEGFGKLMQQGWRPRRSIILGSWDAEEYGMIGSTEWVEENLGLLGTSAVAYVNVDCAVAGPGFRPKATPSMDTLLRDVTRMVQDPEGNYATVFDAWQMSSTGATVGRLGGGGSDYEGFLHHAGVPAMDLAFGDAYPMYHSQYDDFHWMEKFGDPEYRRHVAVTRIWGLVTMRLACYPILPLDYQTYARELQSYAQTTQKQLHVARAPSNVTLAPLKLAVGDLINAAYEIDKESQVFHGTLGSGNQDLFYYLLRRRALNDRLMGAERGLLDPVGIPGREWFKHLVYSPVANDSYNTDNHFPGIVDALAIAEDSTFLSDWKAVQTEIWRLSRAVSRMQLILSGKFLQS